MTEKTNSKVEALPDLDDLLQCPVCYEIPSGQIFQCNEGHHVCGRCKMRLDVCPVCRAFFFGTRNYAMEELIANVQKLQAFKLGGKITTGTPPAEANTENAESSSDDNESTNDNEEAQDDARISVRIAPTACKGLFRCLCCKNNPERLPAARLLNHLRYYHSPDLIEGRSENEEYVQAWQFPTIPGRIVTAVRVADMGIFFLIIEITDESVHSWMQMAASPWVSNEFYYTFTLSGNDREAIFSDCVWSVRSCEGSLKKRGRCLSVSGADARALVQPSVMSGKLSLRRAPRDQIPGQSQPRAVLRVANRSRQHDSNAQSNYHASLGQTLRSLRANVERLSQAVLSLPDETSREDSDETESATQARRLFLALTRGSSSGTPAPRAAPAAEPAPRSTPAAATAPRADHTADNGPRTAPARASAPRAAPASMPRSAPAAATSPRAVPAAGVGSRPAPARAAAPRSAPVTAPPPRSAPIAAPPPRSALVAAPAPRAAPVAGPPPRSTPTAAPAPRPAAAPTPAPRAAVTAAPRPATAAPAAPAGRAAADNEQSHLSRSEARRLRQRVGLALASEEVPGTRRRDNAQASQNERTVDDAARTLNNGRSAGDATATAPNRNQNSSAPVGQQHSNRNVSNNSSRPPNNQSARLQNVSSTARPNSGVANSAPVSANVRNDSPNPFVTQIEYIRVLERPSSPPPTIGGTSQPNVTNGNNSRNKRRRRNRR